MLTEQDNQRLTQVGPGTPAGELLRRYWQPIAALSDLEAERVVPIRVLGERFALFLTNKGDLGLVQEACPHRGTALSLGFPDDDGLRCSYHGWCFGADGACLAQPYDDVKGGSFKNRIKVTSYPVQSLGGLVWAYFGPEPAPLLPRWSLLVEDGLHREIGITKLACNWLTPMENSLDPVHFEWLHAHLSNFLAERAGQPPIFVPRRHLNLDFETFEFGIYKRRLLEGDSEDSDSWRIGHPVIFPNTLAVSECFQIRVPIDDVTTLHVNYMTRDLEEGEEPQTSVPRVDVPYVNEDGSYRRDTVLSQDMATWVEQGPVAARHEEHLSRSDLGIVMYRRMLSESIDRVARGEDPLGLVRDPARNEPMLDIRLFEAGQLAILEGSNYPRGNVTRPLLPTST